MDPASQSRSLFPLRRIHDHTISTLSLPHPLPPLPPFPALSTAHSSLLHSLPRSGLGLSPTISHLLSSIAPGLQNNSLSANYYGFIIGGVTPAARAAECLSSLYDQNVSVHLPEESIATAVEDAALGMLLELFELNKEDWGARTFTTGATASNVLGLACGREWAVGEAARMAGVKEKVSVAAEGILGACRRAGVEKVRVLSTMPHSCVGKAASVLGLGRDEVVNVAREGGLGFDWVLLEKELQEKGTASVVSLCCGEVNTGRFDTRSGEEMRRLRGLCDRYGAWLHVDAAFGIFARCLPSTPEFATVVAGTAGLELADSIAGDGHKLLNVPYDCGFFFSRYKDVPKEVFQNANAAYLSGGSTDIQTPLNIGIENSRRFRALPVYATLMAYGKDGYEEMIVRQVRLCREVTTWIDSREDMVLLPKDKNGFNLEDVFMCVLFQARNERLNGKLVKKINTGRQIYVSGTKWEGVAASRMAIANWQVDVERDFNLIKTVLEGVLSEETAA